MNKFGESLVTDLRGEMLSQILDSMYIDTFPSLYLRKEHAAPRLRDLQRLRLKYWRKIAQQYKPFEHFYGDGIAEANDEMVSNGMLVFEDFLDKNVHSELCSHILSVEDNATLQLGSSGYATLEFTIDKGFGLFNGIAKSLSEATSQYYEKNVSSMHAKITVATHSVTPRITGTLRWHADRFIPVVNGVYFPFGCDWAPFERIIGSPIIVDGSEELLLHHYNEVPTELLGKGIYTSYCKPNTFILGAHHMLHRQKPSASAGKRIALYFEAYNLLSASDLVKNYARKNRHRLQLLNLMFGKNILIPASVKNIILFDDALFSGLD